MTNAPVDGSARLSAGGECVVQMGGQIRPSACCTNLMKTSVGNLLHQPRRRCGWLRQSRGAKAASGMRSSPGRTSQTACVRVSSNCTVEHATRQRSSLRLLARATPSLVIYVLKTPSCIGDRTTDGTTTVK